MRQGRLGHRRGIRGRGQGLALGVAAGVVAATWAVLRPTANAAAAAVAATDRDIAGVTVGLAVSKALSLGVVAGSLVGKLPQVHAIYKASSAKGLSVTSIWMEAVSMGIQFAYSMVREAPLSTYAEVPILYVQLLLLAVMVAWADKYLGPRVWVSCGGLIAGTCAMALRVVPVAMTTALYAANAALGLLIIGPQVIMNFKTRSTGQLSFVVTAMTFFGLSSRLITTLIEVDDLVLRLTVGVNWALMGILMGQFWAYHSASTALPPPAAAGVHLKLPAEPFQIHKSRSANMVSAISKIGSARCMSDLLNPDELDGHLARIRSIPSIRSFSQLM